MRSGRVAQSDVARAGTALRRPEIVAAEAELLERGFPGVLWEGDASAWPDVPREGIRDWVGWVTVVEQMQAAAPELRDWAAGVRARLPHTVLLGMGGSSLAPEVLRRSLRAEALSV